MLRLILAAVGVTAAIILAPTVDAQPKFCDQHGTGKGQIYIHACAGGGGNGGSTMWVKDPVTGLPTQVDQQHVFTDADTTSP